MNKHIQSAIASLMKAEKANQDFFTKSRQLNSLRSAVEMAAYDAADRLAHKDGTTFTYAITSLGLHRLYDDGVLSELLKFDGIFDSDSELDFAIETIEVECAFDYFVFSTQELADGVDGKRHILTIRFTGDTYKSNTIRSVLDEDFYEAYPELRI